MNAMNDWDAPLAEPAPAAPAPAALAGDGWGADLPVELPPDLPADLPAAPAAAADEPAEPPSAASGVALAASPDAAALKAALLGAMERGEARIDAAAVERLPGPALQVLLAAMRDERAAGRSLVVANPSFAFSLAFEAYGFGADTEPFTVEYT